MKGKYNVRKRKGSQRKSFAKQRLERRARLRKQCAKKKYK